MALEQLRKRWESIASPLVSGLGRTNPAVLTWLALPIGVAEAFLHLLHRKAILEH